MTVCIGALGDNRKSAVFVADRMITSGLAIQFEHPVSNKVTELSRNCLALTAGNALAHTELFDQVWGHTNNMISTSVEDFVECIKQTYQRLRQKQIIERYLMPRGFQNIGAFYQAQAGGGLSEGIAVTIFSDMERFNYGLEILIGGLSQAGAHLYQVTDPGTSSCLDSLGFHAIGSGFNLALSSLISNHCHQEMTCPDALLVALEAKMTAENAPGVGKKTDISVILPSMDGRGQVLRFDDGEIKELRGLCRVRRDGDDSSYVQKVADMMERKMQQSTAVPIPSAGARMPRGVNNGETYYRQDESSGKSVGSEPTPDEVQDEIGG